MNIELGGWNSSSRDMEHSRETMSLARHGSLQGEGKFEIASRGRPLCCLTLASMLATAVACRDGQGTPDHDDESPESVDGAVPDAPMPDVEPDVEAVCSVLCPVLESCFGSDPDCPTACSNSLAACSTAELVEIKSCSLIACSVIEECIFQVQCVSLPNCGNGACDLDEYCESCPGDCGACVCGDGYCTAGENSMNCPQDCAPYCGDAICDPGEDCVTCSMDCGACMCGDGVCNLGECATCASDCPSGCYCPHDECTPGEALDPGCSQCIASICVQDLYCCTDNWDPWCVGRAEAICGSTCP